MQLLFTIAALSCVSFAVPTAQKGFTLEQQAHGKKLRSGVVSYARAFEKYGAKVPANVAAAAAAALQSGSVTATPEQYDEAYLCPISVGTPAQSLMMDFDTGSSDLWVFSSEQPASQRSGHKYYTPGSSSTSKKLSGLSWSITYGDGSGAAGNVYSDKVVIGGVTATSQAVEAATSVSSSFVSDTSEDGLVGLAFKSINQVTPTKQNTFFLNVEASLPTPVLGAYLKHDAAGAYDIGFLNTAHYTGTIYYAPVNTANGFWEFTASGYHVGSTSYSGSLDCIGDTGTSIILMPDSVCTNYYNQVSGAGYDSSVGGYIFPCSSTLPTFSVTIGGSSRTVPGSYMNYEPVGSGYCYGGIQSSDGIGFNILGDVFLKSQYVVFDMNGPRIGVATQK